MEKNCGIEHHAVLFALLSKYAYERCGETGRSAILNGMTQYGMERGKRMAENAISDGEELTVLSNQLYGEWTPSPEDQMESGFLQTEPTLQTYVTRCPWCDAWKKHNLLEYGKYYCVNVDKAVFRGFREDFTCTVLSKQLSFGGTRCEFDWQEPLTASDIKQLEKKKKQLGTSRTKDFNFHTAHLYYSLKRELIHALGDIGEIIAEDAKKEYIQRFGQEYFDAFKEYETLFMKED